MKKTEDSRQETVEEKPATCHEQQAIIDGQRTTDNKQPAASDLLPAYFPFLMKSKPRRIPFSFKANIFSLPLRAARMP